MTVFCVCVCVLFVSGRYASVWRDDISPRPGLPFYDIHT